MNNKNKIVTRSSIQSNMIAYVLIAVVAFVFLLIPAATGIMFYKEALFDSYTNRIDGGMRFLCLIVGLPFTLIGLRSFLLYQKYQTYFDATGITQATTGELDARLGIKGFFDVFKNQTDRMNSSGTGGFHKGGFHAGGFQNFRKDNNGPGNAQNSNTDRNASTDYIIFPCGGCETKIRVPKNKGHISVRCPKCGKNTDLFT